MTESIDINTKLFWFKHPANASHEPAMSALEVDYPLIGYALYYKFKEIIISSDDKAIRTDSLNLKLMCKKINSPLVTPEILLKIIQLMAEYEMIQLSETHFTMPKIESEFSNYKSKKEKDRLRMAEWRESQKLSGNTQISRDVIKCNTDATECNTDVTNVSVTNANVTECNTDVTDVTACNAENAYKNKNKNKNNNNNKNNNIKTLINTARMKNSRGEKIENEIAILQNEMNKAIHPADLHNDLIAFIESVTKAPPIPPPPPHSSCETHKGT